MHVFVGLKVCRGVALKQLEHGNAHLANSVVDNFCW